MKWFKRILLGLVIVVVLLTVVGFMLPGSYRVERTQTIKAKPEVAFAVVNNLKTWQEWTAWTVARFPDMKMEFTGPESGMGAGYSWSGKSCGSGKIHITKADASSLIVYDLDFEQGRMVSKGEITFASDGDNVKVKWSNYGELGANPVSRWFGLLMDRFMGPDFQTSLDNLKKRVEAK